ncbi:MAG: hypothetical protein COT92_02655, partial [Candidatus Doudnabacteria bacterium CG10_big_fil_rev_8_21_14_0_10_42_18]
MLKNQNCLPGGGERFFKESENKKQSLKPHQKYQLISALGWPPALLCRITEVSKSGYYKWLKDSGKQPKDYEDYLLVKEIFEKGKKKLGWRPIQMRLNNGYGLIMNHKKIRRIM